MKQDFSTILWSPSASGRAVRKGLNWSNSRQGGKWRHQGNDKQMKGSKANTCRSREGAHISAKYLEKEQYTGPLQQPYSPRHKWHLRNNQLKASKLEAKLANLKTECKEGRGGCFRTEWSVMGGGALTPHVPLNSKCNQIADNTFPASKITLAVEMTISSDFI